MLWPQLIEEANYGAEKSRPGSRQPLLRSVRVSTVLVMIMRIRLLQIDQDHKTTFQVQGKTRQETSAVQLSWS